MKILGATIAILCMLFSGIPCCSFDDCEPRTSVEEEAGKESKENECGQCSPFLVCGTCSGFMLVQEEFCSSGAFIFYPAIAIEGWSGALASDGFIPKIWQPPKLMTTT